MKKVICISTEAEISVIYKFSKFFCHITVGVFLFSLLSEFYSMCNALQKTLLNQFYPVVLLWYDWCILLAMQLTSTSVCTKSMSLNVSEHVK